MIVNKAGNEQCDDGNLLNNDGCSSSWSVENGYIWESSIDVPSTWVPKCGDGFLISGKETWDDGNSDNNDGWSSLCQLQTHGTRYICTTTSYSGSYPPPTPVTIWKDNCTDGYNAFKDMNGVPLAGKESYWDDGNAFNGDGWSSSWAVEQYFEWIGGSLVRADAWRDKWGDGIRISYK